MTFCTPVFEDKISVEFVNEQDNFNNFKMVTILNIQSLFLEQLIVFLTNHTKRWKKLYIILILNKLYWRLLSKSISIHYTKLVKRSRSLFLQNDPKWKSFHCFILTRGVFNSIDSQITRYTKLTLLLIIILVRNLRMLPDVLIKGILKLIMCVLLTQIQC